MTEQAKVPAIRFAGFTDPWEQRKFCSADRLWVSMRKSSVWDVICLKSNTRTSFPARVR